MLRNWVLTEKCRTVFDDEKISLQRIHSNPMCANRTAKHKAKTDRKNQIDKLTSKIGTPLSQQ